MSQSTTTEATIGETLQRLRQEKGLSLRTLASITDFSPSFLSQIENGHTSPSIASLEKLAGALGLTLSDFFDRIAPDVPAVSRASDRKPLHSGWSRAQFVPLVPEGSLRGLHGLLITLGPGGRSGKKSEAQPAEQLALVIDGEVTLTLEAENVELGTGDSAAIPAGCPHRWENVSRHPVTLAVVSPRRRM